MLHAWKDMRDTGIRFGAWMGLASCAMGAIGGALERGWPGTGEPEAVYLFVRAHQAAIVAQSMVFVAGACLFLPFAAALRHVLARVEGETRVLSTTAFASAAIWIALGLVAQSLQIGVARSSVVPDEGLLFTMNAVFSFANLPLAAMLATTARVVLRTSVLPRWLGVVGALAAACEVVLSVGAFVAEGPLAPNGWLSLVLYPAFAMWLVPTAIVMLRRAPSERHAPQLRLVRSA